MARKTRPYFWLIEIARNGAACPAFGDYDRETVQDERRDYREHGVRAIVVKGEARQSWVDAYVLAHNARIADAQAARA